jgi:hypothetical protein
MKDEVAEYVTFDAEALKLPSQFVDQLLVRSLDWLCFCCFALEKTDMARIFAIYLTEPVLHKAVDNCDAGFWLSRVRFSSSITPKI